MTAAFTIPIAFVVTGQETEDDAARWLCSTLAGAAGMLRTGHSPPAVDCWWMPNHQHVDGSDNDGRLVWDDGLIPDKAEGERVRIATSFLLQGSPIEGVVRLLDEGGITVVLDNDEERFLPWTSVGYVVRNAKPEAF